MEGDDPDLWFLVRIRYFPDQTKGASKVVVKMFCLLCNEEIHYISDVQPHLFDAHSDTNLQRAANLEREKREALLHVPRK